MQKCRLYHTGVGESAEGILKDHKVYLLVDGDNSYLPEEMFMAREECESGVIQFEVDGKWGFADIYTGEIVIEPLWDYAGPFYKGYAHVALEVQLEINGGNYIEIRGGKHGYIDGSGRVVIPLEYDAAEDIPYRKYFMVAKDGKWGLIDNLNQILIPLQWDCLDTSYDHDLIFCGRKEACEPYEGAEDRLLAAILNTKTEPTCDYTWKWGVYDQSFTLIVQPDLDERPSAPILKKSPRSKSFCYYMEYVVLKREGKYGVLCKDGSRIADIELSKIQAVELMNDTSGRAERDLYI